MKALVLTTTAKQAGATPFASGFEVVGQVFGAINIMGSDDGTTYTALVTGAASTLKTVSFPMPAYIKLSGAGDGWVLGGV